MDGAAQLLCWQVANKPRETGCGPGMATKQADCTGALLNEPGWNGKESDCQQRCVCTLELPMSPTAQTHPDMKGLKNTLPLPRTKYNGCLQFYTWQYLKYFFMFWNSKTHISVIEKHSLHGADWMVGWGKKNNTTSLLFPYTYPKHGRRKRFAFWTSIFKIISLPVLAFSIFHFFHTFPQLDIPTSNCILQTLYPVLFTFVPFY